MPRFFQEVALRHFDFRKDLPWCGKGFCQKPEIPLWISFSYQKRKSKVCSTSFGKAGAVFAFSLGKVSWEPLPWDSWPNLIKDQTINVSNITKWTPGKEAVLEWYIYRYWYIVIQYESYVCFLLKLRVTSEFKTGKDDDCLVIHVLRWAVHT